MQGDFTRDTFDPTRHFSRVLIQQGRVQLDADWNEQTAILLHTLRTLTRDLFGEHGGPGQGAGFAITGAAAAHDFMIGRGHYYVHGILVENDAACWYRGGADLPPQPDHKPEAALEKGKNYLVYLDVWERHISSVEDDDIREKALLGPDTATRAKVIWQVKVDEMNAGVIGTCDDLAATLRRSPAPQAKARVMPIKPSVDPCIQAPNARYRGAENQLYRVEVHQGGRAGATFKWSRDNGSVIFPVVEMNGVVATLEHLGRDARLGLQVGDWVEVVDDDQSLRGDPGPMLQVDAIDAVEMKVTLKTRAGVALLPYDETSRNHPYLRRWDHKTDLLGDGAVLLLEDNADQWLDLEDGVQVQFQPGGDYRSGDYWLIPARTATGQVEWPGPVDAPEAQPPQGIHHNIAPLAQIEVDATGVVTVAQDCRLVMTSAMHGL
ncbi:MAG: hypothetical protein KDI07_09565 [Anaerolineae bacterium]|nr:hypothetical protein [Anaerolineae bacterium]MCB0238980.1 hypothetical protein [Anaerolineae bacterium]MCB0248815.1 hypothetical protein [Anaerolineae bacterium]MCB9122844.1 hypothetical protein [Caldilineaceae bacterium]